MKVSEVHQTNPTCTVFRETENMSDRQKERKKPLLANKLHRSQRKKTPDLEVNASVKEQTHPNCGCECSEVYEMKLVT